MIDGMDPEDWIDRLVRDATDKADRISRAVSELQQRSFVSRTDDRSVEVEVNHGGTVTAIRLAGAVRDRDPDRLASELMACIRRAGRDAATAAQESMAPALGSEPTTMAGLRQATEQQ
ncbi:MAG: YbaB/EbfC family nucleoid-associated protein, partial [Pseudonocardiaceae bacterium]